MRIKKYNPKKLIYKKNKNRAGSKHPRHTKMQISKKDRKILAHIP
jgi:hypothetical protein